MPPPSGAQHAAPAFRIYQGDTILGVGWSNVAANMDGFFRVVYDDGEPETIRWDRTVATSARAAFLITSAQVARKDGFVTEGAMFGDAPQRGQTYVVAYISQGYQPGDVRSVLAKGYVYASTPLQIGQQVEPGPAGGHGMLKNARTASTAISTGLADATPTGALWRVRSARYFYTASATVGTRVVVALPRDASGNELLAVQSLSLTTGQTGFYELVESHQDSTTAHRGGSSPNATVIEVLPGYWLMATGFDLFIKDLAAIDVADTVVREIMVEEWVMPN